MSARTDHLDFMQDVDLDADPIEDAQVVLVENPAWDAEEPQAEPRFVRGGVESGGGGGGGEALRGAGQIDHPDTDAQVSHGLPRTPEPGEIQIQPRNVAHDVQRHAVAAESSLSFTVEVDPAPGDGNTFQFGWLWVPADLADPPTYPDLVLEDNPFGYWRFSETSGSTTADEVASNDGAVVGANLDVPGAVGSGISYDGVDDYVDLGTLGTFGSTMGAGCSFEMWLRWTETSSEVRAAGIYNDNDGTTIDVRLNRNTAGTVAIFIRGGNNGFRLRRSNRTDLNDGEWHHVVFTWPGGSPDPNCYVDGVLDNGPTATSGTPGSFTDFEFGMALGAMNLRGSITEYWEGSMDEFACYLDVLSASRVAAHFEAA